MKVFFYVFKNIHNFVLFIYNFLLNRWDFKRYVTKCTFKFVKKKKKNYGERDYIYLKNENNPNLSHNRSLTYHYYYQVMIDIHVHQRIRSPSTTLLLGNYEQSKPANYVHKTRTEWQCVPSTIEYRGWPSESHSFGYSC